MKYLTDVTVPKSNRKI